MSTSFKSEESRRPSSNKDGDWICPDSDCKNLNFARRSQCNRCGHDRPHGSEKTNSSSTGSGSTSTISDASSGQSGHPGSGIGGSKKKIGIEIGKHAAEKSRGLFSAEDWQCSKCANVNWARRHTCNLCNAPRFCEVEERTGYGGGYNDRGVVEYKERSESDDEYDEFGRRKKKRSNSDSRSKTVPKEVQPNQVHKKTHTEDNEEEEEDDDEDDEDDDNGDLSKYDLWGSDAEDSKAGNNKPSQLKQNRRKDSSSSSSSSKSYSRSRSRSPRGRNDRNRNRSTHSRSKRSRSRSRSPRSSKSYNSTSHRR